MEKIRNNITAASPIASLTAQRYAHPNQIALSLYASNSVILAQKHQPTWGTSKETELLRPYHRDRDTDQ
jgi:hypothetical protein